MVSQNGLLGLAFKEQTCLQIKVTHLNKALSKVSDEETRKRLTSQMSNDDFYDAPMVLDAGVSC